jgi:cytochrome b pre-mRNA-processing protein 3
MEFWAFLHGPGHRQTTAAQALYERLVAQARQPEFFADLGVPDNLDGRFETLALHAFLALSRIKAELTEEAGGLAQALFDIFFVDMDRSLREMGASDLGVGRRVKAMAQGLYGRIQAYERGLREGDPVLEPALRRNLYGTVAEPRATDLASMAHYLRCQDRALAAQPISELLAGHIAFLPIVQATAGRSPNDPG